MKTVALITLITLIGCSSKKVDENLNTQAIILHNSMMKKANEIKHRLAQFENDSLINADSVSALQKMLEKWEAEIVEVPGNESHDHKGHNHHDHKPLDITAEQMLAIQKELDVRLSRIAKRTTELKSYDETLHQH